MNREQERKYLEESPEVAAYLSHMGLRPESDGFRFLLFVINQLRRGTPVPQYLLGSNGPLLWCRRKISYARYTE